MAIVINNHHGLKPFPRTKRCKLPSFTQADFAHSAKHAANASNFHRSLSTPCLSLANNKAGDVPNTSPRIEIVGGFGALGVRGLVVEVAMAIVSGVHPVLVPSGLGGAYYLSSCNGDNIAVVKPVDEEPLALNNPKGYVGRVLGQPGLKHSVRVGENGVREVAAYLIDHGGFAGVPPTALVKISNVAFNVNHHSAMLPMSKIASIQRFVDHDFDAGDLGMSGFSVSSVHRIGILDIRLLNLDRHAGNILVKRKNKHDNTDGDFVNERYAIGDVELVPIDHGLCLPEQLDDPYFEWLHWPQAALPFSESEAEYICQLDPLKDAELLRSELPSLRESSIRVLILCTIFLKRAAAAGLRLADVGNMMTREHYGTEQSPSLLETLCFKAKAAMNNKLFDSGKNEDDKEGNILQFDTDCNQSCSDVVVCALSHWKPSKVSKLQKVPMKYPTLPSSSALVQELLISLHEEDDNVDHGKDESSCDNDNAGDDEDVISSNDQKVTGGLIRSVSFYNSKVEHENEGMSFGDMSEEGWVLFLEHFEKLLPKVFEVRKSTRLKQRLGTSCKF
ncbi:hypothetical protein Sjap_012209 [Stephania japonica]|uniref:1-phosphatidylinositol 4-kinase n=1 Tax=Stephania japonica TaxID=461633 RepID=A0AAP0IVH6_9MAGN